MRIIEVSHRIVEGMRTYPGLPEPRIEVLLDYDASRARFAPDEHGEPTEFYIATLHCCGNTGTYVDSPRHRYRNGVDLADLPLERVAHLPIEVIDVRGDSAVTHRAVTGRHLNGKAVLFHTGWSAHWRTDKYFEPNPHLTADACRALLDAGAVFAGIDSVNIDSLADLRRPAHSILLGAGVPVCEHMTNLAALPEQGYLHAAPIAWEGGATFPVRAYVLV
jgi:kynurenine formamidase